MSESQARSKISYKNHAAMLCVLGFAILNITAAFASGFNEPVSAIAFGFHLAEISMLAIWLSLNADYSLPWRILHVSTAGLLLGITTFNSLTHPHLANFANSHGSIILFTCLTALLSFPRPIANWHISRKKMPKFQFSITQLLIVSTMAALAVAYLKRATPIDIFTSSILGLISYMAVLLGIAAFMRDKVPTCWLPIVVTALVLASLFSATIYELEPYASEYSVSVMVFVIAGTAVVSSIVVLLVWRSIGYRLHFD